MPAVVRELDVGQSSNRALCPAPCEGNLGSRWWELKRCSHATTQNPGQPRTSRDMCSDGWWEKRMMKDREVGAQRNMSLMEEKEEKQKKRIKKNGRKAIMTSQNN
jgi:hypothetical protein